jgi:AcrR family transcriptional regulator
MSSKKQKTRESLLDAAWKRLERGDAAKLEDVGADVGVSRQSVYLHFGSRGGMLLALVAHIDETLGLYERLAALRQIDDPIELLKATLDMAASYQPKVQGVAMALMRLAEQDEEVRAAFENRMEERRKGLAATIEQLARAGLLRKEWSKTEMVDLLWEATSPSSFQHLVVELGWKPARYRDWLTWIALSFVRTKSPRA